MKLNNDNSGDSAESRASDFLRLIAKSLVLEHLISKSLRDALDEFCLDKQLEDKSPRTIDFYRARLKPFVLFLGADTELHSLTPTRVKEYFASLDTSHRFGYHAHFRAARAFLNWCVKQNYLAKSPLTFSPPKWPHTVIPIFTDADIKAMLAQCQGKLGPRNRAIILMLLDTGMRLAEIANLKLGDVELQGRLVEVLGKGRKKRTLPVSATTLKAVWQYLRNHRREPGCDALWVSEEGQPLGLRGISEMVQRAAQAAAVTGKKLGPHTFRHTFANSFLDAGGDPLDLKYLLGHSSLAMVENYSRAHQARRAIKSQQGRSAVDRLGLK